MSEGVEFSARVKEILAKQAKERSEVLELKEKVKATEPVNFAQGDLLEDADHLPEVHTGQSTAPPLPLAIESEQHRTPYTPEGMVDIILNNPDLTHAQYAKCFGRTTGWFASVLASEKFQLALEPYRHLIHDPAISASLDERFRGLAMRGLFVLQSKLEKDEVTDYLALKVADLGIKALGLGNVAHVEAAPVAVTGAEAVADRIMQAMASAKARTRPQIVDVESVTIVSPPDGS